MKEPCKRLRAAGNDFPGKLATRTAEYRAALSLEIGPRGTLESILLDAVARHAAAMEVAAEVELAAFDFAGKNSTSVHLCHDAKSNSAQYFAGLMSPIVAESVRYRVAHERAFLGTLRALREATQSTVATPNLFANEDACTEHLARWQRLQPWLCSHCGSSKRCWLRRRLRFECDCGRQLSIRYATVFAGSRASLLAWFTVVISLIVAPDLSTADLAQKMSIVRRATVREMAARVRDALAAPDRDKLLAGLPQLVACHLRQVYQRVAQFGAFPGIMQPEVVPIESTEFAGDLT